MESQAEILNNFIIGVKETERRLEEGQDDYALEFLKIRVDSDDLREMDEFKSVVGARGENFRKNRYRDILPFDYSRVTIDVKPARSDFGDYVNASFINGANDKVAYIATQGPLKETVADFWQMVYQYEVTLIIMLCDLVESGKPKCEKYWPEAGTKAKFGELRITLESEVREKDHYVIRTMRIKRKSSSEKDRMIFQFQYYGWPDHGTPDEIAPLIDFVNRLRDYQSEDQYSPLVVHCSAGCGRTGTICALDYVRTLIRAKRVPADFGVCNLVSELRKQRPAMVQSKEQYILLHRAIALMFEQELTHSHPNALQVNVSELFISSPPLTPAPPVPVENSCSPKQNSLPAQTASLSPSPSSETSGTSVSEDGGSVGHSHAEERPNIINGGGTTMNIAQERHVTNTLVPSISSAEGGDNSSVTSYETFSTNKTDGLSEVEEEIGDKNDNHGDTIDQEGLNENSNAISSLPDSRLPLGHSTVNDIHSTSPMFAPTASTYSSLEMTKAGSNETTIPAFPEKLAERPMGTKAQPTSWPDHEDVLQRIHRL